MVTHETFSPLIRQSFVAFGPVLLTMSLGLTEGYSTILLPALNVDEDTSMAVLPMALGCILGGYFMEKSGRKSTLMLTCLPSVIAWSILYFASDLTMILTGKFLMGLGVGLSGPPAGVYVGEMSDPKYRGLLLAAVSSATALGLFLSRLVPAFVSRRTTTLACCTSLVISVFCMVFAPESPTWLARIGEIERAKAAFLWCRGTGDQELDVLVSREFHEFKSTFETMKKPEFVKPLCIIVVFFITCQWSGFGSVTPYSVSQIQQTLGSDLGMLTVDAIRVTMSVVAGILLIKLGRRPLAIISSTGTFTSLFLLSSFTFAVKFYPAISAYTCVPFVSLIAYISFITVGFVPLPWIMMAEVFPSANRGAGGAISALSAHVALLSVANTAPSMFARFRPEGTFFIYGVVALAGTIVLILFLPETKDKALYRIEDSFK